ncbi:MAG: Peptide-methionine (R)-S-oxide reductase MsrB [uncultured Lysobacter sp.]|uniref:peptide-methionine (R)-S-oxide reductase n=1 Tax=uncultured Lysobacter sp. TaxID=271060 RepID=A0A6J4KYM6_9GAMM|nr:MAG: Peptide-methionine (R)-S-oxide reductase MsrB [uncultured Lysobacter sp.]
MNRRSLLQGLAGMAALSLFSGCTRAAPAAKSSAVTALKHPESYWRGKVSPAAYAVLFEEDTERSGSSPLDREKRAGTFVCAACHLPLFVSRYKFDSGTGWPSFTQPIPGHMATKTDYRMFLPRTEYHCARCGGHQGHVFDDGPPPRGERWCNNGLALRFVPQGQTLPALRG